MHALKRRRVPDPEAHQRADSAHPTSGVRRVAAAASSSTGPDEDERAQSITRTLLGVALGSLDRVPVLARSLQHLRTAGVDERQSFVLGFVDGERSIEAVGSASGLALHQVLLTLTELLVQGRIAFRAVTGAAARGAPTNGYHQSPTIGGNGGAGFAKK